MEKVQVRVYAREEKEGSRSDKKKATATKAIAKKSAAKPKKNGYLIYTIQPSTKSLSL